MDRRDALIAELNKEVKLTVLKQSDGASNVFVGNGQALVLGAASYSLSTLQSPTDPERILIGYSSQGGAVLLPESGFDGGNLGGLLAFAARRSNRRATRWRIAITLADSFNLQHQLGQDINGALGGQVLQQRNPLCSMPARTTPGLR